MKPVRALAALSLAVGLFLGPTVRADAHPHHPPYTALFATYVTGVLRARAAAVAYLHEITVENFAANVGDCHAIMVVAARYFPAGDLPTLAHVIWHESSRAFTDGEAYNPNPPPQTLECDNRAYNPSGASGLTQGMMPLHRAILYAIFGCNHPGAEFDAVCNIQLAATLHRADGWSPWAGAT